MDTSIQRKNVKKAKTTHAGFLVGILGLWTIAKTNVAARRNAKK